MRDGLDLRNIHDTSTSIIPPITNPSRGDRKMKTRVLVTPAATSELNPTFATAAPIRPPMSAWDDDDGRPAHQVMMFHALAPTGKKILILERGGFVPREKDNWNSRAVVTNSKYNTKEEWRDSKGKPLHPHTNYYVGGNTKFYAFSIDGQ